MQSTPLNAPPDDIRTEWSRLDKLIVDVQGMQGTGSDQPGLITLRRSTDDSIIVDISGLIQALAAKNINILS